MIHSCELCGNDFLTEADPYVVRPTPQGVKLYCYCMIKGFEEMKGAEKLKEENKKLVEALKFYINSAPDGMDRSFGRKVLKEIGEE
jgi:hypothetical protein